MTTFRTNDVVEATEHKVTEAAEIKPGERYKVLSVSAAGNYIRLAGHSAFIRASGFKKVVDE